jgi:hypothetical protein
MSDVLNLKIVFIKIIYMFNILTKLFKSTDREFSENVKIIRKVRIY